jgi:hypothetical protein
LSLRIAHIRKRVCFTVGIAAVAPVQTETDVQTTVQTSVQTSVATETQTVTATPTFQQRDQNGRNRNVFGSQQDH